MNCSTKKGFLCPKINPEDLFVFDKEDARKYGLGEAIILHHIKFWILNNRNNPKVMKEGKVWMYTPVRKLEEMYSFFTEKKIRTRIKKLEKMGVLVISNHAEMKNHHTNWYTLGDEEYEKFFAKNKEVISADKTVTPAEQMVRTKEIEKRVPKKTYPPLD